MQRRPIFFFLLAQIAGILLAHYVPFGLAAAFAVAALAAGAAALRGGRHTARAEDGAAAGGRHAAREEDRSSAAQAQRPGRMPAALFAWLLLAFFLLGALRTAWAKDHTGTFPSLAGQVVQREGLVLQASAKDGRCTLDVDCGGERLRVRLADSLSAPEALRLIGRRVRFTGRISLPDARRNPGTFDYRLYLKSKDIHALCDVSRYKFRALETARPLRHFLACRKADFFEKMQPLLDADRFGILAGVLFGETSYMDGEDYEEMQRSGIAHILAVSGLHVSLLVAFVQRVTGKRKSLAIRLTTLALVFCYALLCGFSVSVLRASCMLALRTAAEQTHRRYDQVCAAAATAVLFLTANPYILFLSGAQLSYAAAFCMGIPLPWFQYKFRAAADRRKNTQLRTVGYFFSPGLAILAGSSPLTCFHFLGWSPLAILVNPLAILLAGILLPAGLAAFLVSALPGSLLLAGAAGVCGALARALDLLSAFASRHPGRLALPAPSLPMLLLAMFFTFFFFSELRYVLRRKRRERCVTAVCLAAFAACCVLPWAANVTNSSLPWRYNACEAVFLDVGQGDSAHLRAGVRNILIDGGGSPFKDTGKETLAPYLRKNGTASIDLAFVSHLDSDHAKGVAELSQQMEIRCIAFPSACRGSDLSAFRAENVVFLSAGDRVEFGGDASVLVLSPRADETVFADDNDASLVLLWQSEAVSILFPGDIGAAREESLLASGIPHADILKAAHHGSAYSSCETFVRAVDPAVLAVSCGRNNRYGHPAPRVLALARDLGIITCRTDESGAICLRKVTQGRLLLENGAKDTKWLLPRHTNTPTRPLPEP